MYSTKRRRKPGGSLFAKKLTGVLVSSIKTLGENEGSDQWSTHLGLSRINYEIFERPVWASSNKWAIYR